MTVQIRALYDWFNGIGALAVAGEETAGAVVRALDELLAYREGYDPQEREPELGQWVVVEDIGLTTPDSPGKYVMRWTDTPDCVRWEWEDTEEEGDVEPQVFYVDMGVTWTYRTKSEVKRWYPIGGA